MRPDPRLDAERGNRQEARMPDNEADRMLKWFRYDHLPLPLRAASSPFGVLAEFVCASTEPGPERTVCLRKLLEAKDAAVRASLTPGG